MYPCALSFCMFSVVCLFFFKCPLLDHKSWYLISAVFFYGWIDNKSLNINSNLKYWEVVLVIKVAPLFHVIPWGVCIISMSTDIRACSLIVISFLLPDVNIAWAYIMHHSKHKASLVLPKILLYCSLLLPWCLNIRLHNMLCSAHCQSEH